MAPTELSDVLEAAIERSPAERTSCVRNARGVVSVLKERGIPFEVVAGVPEADAELVIDEARQTDDKRVETVDDLSAAIVAEYMYEHYWVEVEWNGRRWSVEPATISRVSSSGSALIASPRPDDYLRFDDSVAVAAEKHFGDDAYMSSEYAWD